MEFTLLEIENFLAIGKADPLNLSNQGLVLIQGVNEDDSSATSNGVGKSSIADALCWAIYGETARGVSGDDVVNETAKKNTQVRVTIKDGDMNYIIARHRKHNKAKNTTVVGIYPDGGSIVDVTKGTEKETQELINEIMGCSLDVFMASIYAGQEVMPDLPKMTDKQLKLLIEEAGGTERLSRAYGIARDECNALEREMLGTVTAITAKKANVETLHDRLVSATAKQIDFEDTRKGASEGHRKTAEAIAEEIKVMVAQLNSKGLEALEMRLGEVNAELVGLTAQHKEHKKLTDESIKLGLASSKCKGDLDYSIKRIKDLQVSIAEAENDIGKPCGECGKEHTAADVDQHKAAITELLRTEAEKYKVRKLAFEEAQDACRVFEEKVVVSEGTLPSMSDLLTELAVLSRGVTECGRLTSSIALKKKDLVSQIEASKSAMTTPNPHTSAVETIKDQSMTEQAGLLGLEARLNEQTEKMDIAADVMRVFGPAGVRAHVLDTITPFLNDRTSDYLSALSDGNISAVWTTLTTTAKGDLKEKFNIEVSNDKGAKSFSGLSGGEKRKVRLATMLALQDLVASRATKPIGLWMGDEIDDALDAAGLERLMGILERKARERGTVLVISHGDLRDWIDQVTTVTKRGGTSIIEGALVV